MNRSTFLPAATVVKLAAVTEAIFIVVSLLWIGLADLDVHLDVRLSTFLYGVLTCTPMLIFNILIFGYLSKDGSRFPIYGEFKRSVVIPLCGNLSVSSALFLALCSGFAEELFFRGALFSQLTRWMSLPLAAIIVAALFSYVHFIGVLKRYWQISLFYFLFGLYFCAIVVVNHQIFGAIVTHILYNFSVILYLRYIEIPKLYPSITN